MLDYDLEARRYDDTRGGVERARAAADAVCSLVPAGSRCLDVAGGTGIVSAELAARGFDVVVLDRSVGMLELAAARLPGRVVVGDAPSLPLADASVDLVTTIWLLHLVPDLADAVVAEAARVLRPGGHWVTSVDKDPAHARAAETDADGSVRLGAVARGVGLVPTGTTSFEGSTIWTRADGDGTRTFRLAGFRKAQ